MKIEKIDIKKLKPYKKNARIHSKDQIDQIAKSIQEFGFTNPVLIDKEFSVIAGHGRIEAAKNLKLKEIPCIKLNGITEEKRKALIIADNKISLNAKWDYDILAEEMKYLLEEDFDLLATGFNEKEIDSLLEEVEIENVDFPDVIPPEEITYILISGEKGQFSGIFLDKLKKLTKRHKISVREFNEKESGI